MTELPPLPEYVYGHECSTHERVYTADQMRAYAAEAVRVALEQAARVAKDAFQDGFYAPRTYNDTVLNTVDDAWEEAKPAILRALKGAP